MRARVRKFGVKTRPQSFLAQNLFFVNGSTAFRFPKNPEKSPSLAFRFLHRLSDFFNGFPISSTAFGFLQRLSNFFNSFPISKKPSSTAFRFLLYCQNTHILNILTFRSELRNSRVKIFRLSILSSTNRHSPHSLASVNSLTPKSVPAGAKKILFGRYVLNIYVGIVRYFLRTTKLSAPKSTYRHNAQIIRF